MYKRRAFKMQLYPGMVKEYEKRHNEIWPELVKLLKENGISEYSIFYDEETHILFGFQKQAGEQGSQDLGTLEIVKKWWAHMADMYDTHPDNSPVTKPLTEVFYME
ncbi:MAG: L-rhamnose mutarotase [Bacteroidota bacterium]